MNVKITFGFLCYNTKDISRECFEAIRDEAQRLYPLVGRLNLAVMDNGTDGSGREFVYSLPPDRPFDQVALLGEGVNYGQSSGRNKIIRAFPSDYILFIDGDIRVIPGSIYQMLLYIHARPNMGCLSPHPMYQTTNPEVASPAFKGIEISKHRIRSACTGYALYRSEVFKNGIQFEESGPFYGPGWGLEDDDMYLQLKSGGWEIDYFTGQMYLQRKQRSSWDSLREAGIDIAQKFEERKEFFLRKWETKSIDPAILQHVKAQNLRGYSA